MIGIFRRKVFSAQIVWHITFFAMEGASFLGEHIGHWTRKKMLTIILLPAHHC